MRLREQIGIEQPDEVGEAIIIAVVRRGGQQHNVVGIGG